MKKVAIVITRMLAGGASIFVRQIMDVLKDEFDFTLFTGVEDISSNEKETIEERYRTIFVPSLVRQISPIKDIRAYLELKRYFTKIKFDIVHTHTSKAGFLGRIAARRAGIKKIIHSTHGTIYQPGTKIPGVFNIGLYKKILLESERFVGTFTNKLLVLSEREKILSESLGLAGGDRIRIIPNGINVNDFSRNESDYKKSRADLGISDDIFFILSVGRLSEEKGHKVLISAFRELCGKSDRKILLGLVGDGPLRTDLERANIDLLSSGKLVFWGYQADVKKYLHSADLFVLSSFYEGFGLALLEAMACGLRIVASDTGGVSELLGNNFDGFLYESKNYAKLRSTMESIIEKSPRGFYNSSKNISRAELFDLGKIMRVYRDLYVEK